ncbi:hypothetical protein [Phaffia rhodozyma]|uniref:Uncharacterized protein n=1 Tax=Phaffia rhodozyma TaxID=264483 RepID=A0A0F7ST42_PHARH|nr:hypothetical protein [Phaffia rhodozyma]
MPSLSIPESTVPVSAVDTPTDSDSIEPVSPANLLQPYATLLTPYSATPHPSSSSPPPAPAPLPPFPSSSLRCFLLSSSLPPLPQHVAFIPYTPYTPSLAPPSGPNVERSRAVCWRRKELTKEDWARERKGVEKWVRWLEGKELVLVSGSEAVRSVLFDREPTGGSDEDKESLMRAKQERTVWGDNLEKYPRQSSRPLLSDWVQGREDFIQPLPLQPPFLSVLQAALKVSTTMSTMVTRYVQSFTDGTQLGAFNLIWERTPLALEFLVEKVPQAWKNLPDNLKSIIDPDGGTGTAGTGKTE